MYFRTFNVLLWFWYAIYLFIICHCFHMVRITCLLSAFRKDRYETNQNSVFEYGFIHCIRVIIVLGLLLYLRFCHGLTKGEIVKVMCFGIVNHAKLCVFYWVLMCLKVVIEDQVEDTKFAQEKLKKNTFSTCTSIAAR